jgi:hypothetical protein
MKNEFKKPFNIEIAKLSKLLDIDRSKAFLAWFAINVLELSEDEAREAISVEGANDKGIDLFWVDDDEGRIIIGQGKYSKTLNHAAKESDVAKLESSLNWLANPEALRREGRTELAQASEDYMQALKNGYGLEMWYFYAGPKASNIERHVAVFNQNPENLAKRRALRHYHIELIRSIWQEISGTVSRIPSEEIAIQPGNTLGASGNFGRAVVANLAGEEIVRLYTKYEDRLFDRNVRLFLGAKKGSVNAGIAETLRNSRERQHFWAYNNGLTFVCDDFKLKPGNLLAIKHFSIVNGCQTTVSLAQNPDAARNTKVLVRFIAASSEILDNVITFNNSQNPIRTWDIASQNKTQKRLKKELASLGCPYIYMTRRGDRPKEDLKKFREKGKLRQIKIDILGQYAAAFRGTPVLGYKQKALIFSTHHDTVFPPDIRVEEVVLIWNFGEVCREVVRLRIAKGSDQERRILKKGGTLFVLATAARIAQLRNGAAFQKTISEERASSNSACLRLRKYAEYASLVYLSSVSDLKDSSGEELTTLLRSDKFFEKVLERVEREYKKNALSDKWLSDALPKLF